MFLICILHVIHWRVVFTHDPHPLHDTEAPPTVHHHHHIHIITLKGWALLESTRVLAKRLRCNLSVKLLYVTRIHYWAILQKCKKVVKKNKRENNWYCRERIT